MIVSVDSRRAEHREDVGKRCSSVRVQCEEKIAQGLQCVLVVCYLGASRCSCIDWFSMSYAGEEQALR